MFVGGYWGTLLAGDQFGADRTTEFAPRNTTEVSIGSSGVSRYDTIPCVHALIDGLPFKPTRALDIGCGDGSYLVSLLETGRVGRAHGLDVSRASLPSAASTWLEGGHLSVADCSFQDFVGSGKHVTLGADCFIAAFVLQEVLAQTDRETVIRLMQQLRPSHRAVLILIEVAPAWDDRLNHGIGRAYYNPYFLLHEVTRQTLLPFADWDDMMERAGWSLIEYLQPPANVDGTGFQRVTAYSSGA